MAAVDRCVVDSGGFGDGGGVAGFAADSAGFVGVVIVVAIVVVVEEEGVVSGGVGVVAAEWALVLLPNRAGARPGRRGSGQIESIDR
ncbi:hypothetical protein BDP55DRAFT_660302 [Colletotrichum godetiae]|uniref:Uncharacterized protein n=1 Tax=Colletotrichum godetiae TaxID=1209918 RepID=A0AAJ0ASX8_9PEZI|nr:uncharacterized protein BDP55DRAFT_660302 [Colletotrichum godetiae]KAK1687529.1 hypothetical protein BDP55DRAFT_660302 [Colletotrichum godetiae]